MNDTEIIRKAVETIQRLGSSAQDCKSCARLTLCNAYQDGNSFQGCDYKWIHADDAYGLPFNQWISVEEKVPDVSGKYLCYLAYNEIEVVYFEREIEDDEYNLDYPFGVWNTYPSKDGGECREWIEVLEVTHWMPLPEPPKDGDTK